METKIYVSSSRSFLKNGILFSCFFLFFFGSSWGQTTVFTDDFSTSTSATYTTSGTIGASAWSVLTGGTAGQDFGARRNTTPAQLELTNDATAAANANGWTFTSTLTSSFLSPYNTTLNLNPGVVSWTFNMRQIRIDPAGLTSGSYGVAYVLAGASTTTATVGTGYAVALGQSGTTDPIRLIKYSAGLATSTNIITSNTSGLTDFGAEYLSIQILYTPSTNTWELLLRNDGASAFADPATGTLTSQGTAVDATYTGSTLTLMGGYWSGSTAASQTAFFDNTKVTVASGCTPPSTQTSGLSASSATTSQFNLNWTSGNGNGTMIVVRPTSQSLVAPSSGTAYTANTDYASAGQINTNNRVVFRNAGTSVTTTNLSAATQYTATAYEYNTTGDCYNITSPPSSSIYTLSLEPTAHAGSFTATAATPTSIDLSFSAATTITNASGYIILQKQAASAPTGTPSDATAYSVGNTIGDATVAAIITNTASTTSTINSLSTSTQYYYTLIPFNWDGVNAATYNYYTAVTIPSATATTLSLSAPSISSNTSTAITNTTATLGANVTSDGGATITARGVVWAETTLNNDPTIGGSNSTNVTGTGTTGVYTVAVTSLPVATQISFKGYATNSQGTSYTSASTFYTLANPTSVAASSIVFGSYSTSSIQLSWTNGDGANRIVVARATATSIVAPTNGIGYSVNSTNFTDGLNATTGTGNVVIFNGTGSAVTVTGLTAGTSYTFDIYEYNGTGLTANYGTVFSGSKPTLSAEPTVQASAVTFTNVTATGFKINWTLGNGANSLVVVKDASVVDSDPVDGSTYTANSIFSSGSLLGSGNYVVYKAALATITISGLTDGHTYYVAVYTFNGFSGSENYLTTSPATGSQLATTTTFYSQGSLDPNILSNWNTIRVGGGSSPATFTDGNFVVQNTHNMTTTTAWSVGSTGSTLQIESGGILTANNAITVASGSTFKIDGGGTYIHNNTSAASTTIFNGTENFAASSNVTIQNWATTTAIPAITFGNLTITYSPSSAWNQTQNLTHIQGTFTLNNGSANAFRFGGNASLTLTIDGDLIINSGILQFNNASSGNTYILNLGGSYNQTGGTFDPNTGTSNLTINFTGAGKNFIQSAGTLTNTRINWSIANSASLTLNSDFALASSRTFSMNATSSLVVAAGKSLIISGTADFANQNVTFKSDATGTARLGIVSGTLNNATNVTVERYIPAGKRAYRQLASGVTTTTFISNNWQQGIHITGNAGSPGLDPTTGFDNTQTGNKNMFTYTPGAAGFTGISNTNATNLNAKTGYRVFVLGDRTSDLTVINNTGTGTPNIPSSAATIKATGTLLTGAQSFTSGASELSAVADGYALIANPYWSPVDWDALTKSNVNATYWIFDQSIGNRGAYTSWTTGSGASGGGAITKDIQPGQAIFVQTTANGAAQIDFAEANKTSTFTSTFRPVGQSPSKLVVNLIGAYGTNPVIVKDASTIAFRDDFSTAVLGTEDAQKFTNSDENIAIMNATTALGLEARPTVANSDIIPVRLWKLFDNNTYSLKLNAQDFDAGIQAYLRDKKNNTQTAINMSGETIYPFTFASTDSSSFYNRFEIVFSNSTALPANFTNIKAYRKNTGIQVEWDIAAETAIKTYEVQRSEYADGFTTVASVNATANNGKAANYDWFDASPFKTNNYYRIKVVGANGEVKYSSIVKVGNSKEIEKVSVYPNPLEGNVVTLQLGGIADGKYEIQLYSSTGQQMMSTSISKQGAVQTQTLSLPKNMSAGVYRLSIRAEDGTIYNRNIIKL